MLMVSKLDRLSQSVHDASGLLLRADKSGWDRVALDLAVDTTTPAGRATAQLMALFAERERRLIGERTKAALAIKMAQGVTLGRPHFVPTRSSNGLWAQEGAEGPGRRSLMLSRPMACLPPRAEANGMLPPCASSRVAPNVTPGE